MNYCVCLDRQGPTFLLCSFSVLCITMDVQWMTVVPGFHVYYVV